MRAKKPPPLALTGAVPIEDQFDTSNELDRLRASNQWLATHLFRAVNSCYTDVTYKDIEAHTPLTYQKFLETMK